jgi:putative transposase
MARPLRIEFPGAVYHVTTRGNGREDIFVGNSDRMVFLALLTELIERFGWLCHAYCLMNNHFHLMVETPGGDLGRGMRHLNGVFTQRFNRAHQRVGHVFQGRYKAILVEKEAYLAELARHVVLNPVRAGLADDVAEWGWSSYRATAGLQRKPGFLTTSWLLAQFGEPGAGEKYQRFVAGGLEAESPWKRLATAHVMGGAGFLERVRGLTEDKSGEVLRLQRRISRPSLSELRKRFEDRAGWMARAHREHGYTLMEIAGDCDLHFSTVSKIIKGWKPPSNSRIET